MKKFVASIALVLAVLAMPVAALAAEFRAAQGNNGAVDLAKDQTAKNLYMVGNIVNVSGSTSGDLVAAGNTLNLLGSVENGLFAAGSNINLGGKVGGNTRIAGSNITINNAIGGDLFIGAATVNIAKEATIAGDLIAGIGTIDLNGDVAGNVRIAGGTVNINGKIDGDLQVEGGTLNIGDHAVINGNLKYRAEQTATISKSAVIKGSIDYQKIQSNTYNSDFGAAAMGVFGFFGILMGLALLFVLVYLLPRSSRDLVIGSLSSFWKNLGWGFLTFAVAPTALLMIAFTFIGLKLAGILTLAYIVYLIVAFSYATIGIGAAVLKWIEKKDYRVDWASILVGSLTVAILSAIPFLGGLVIFAVALAVLGQMMIATSHFLKNQRK